MKKSKLIQGFSIVFLLIAFAMDAQERPLENQQPKSRDGIEADSSRAESVDTGAGFTQPINQLASESKYPAADFQPKVIYYNEAVAVSALGLSRDSEKAENDTKFPAANFQPKVIYFNPEMENASAL